MIDDVDNKWRFHAKRKSSPKIQSSDRRRKLTGFLGNSNFWYSEKGSPSKASSGQQIGHRTRHVFLNNSCSPPRSRRPQLCLSGRILQTNGTTPPLHARPRLHLRRQPRTRSSASPRLRRHPTRNRDKLQISRKRGIPREKIPRCPGILFKGPGCQIRRRGTRGDITFESSGGQFGVAYVPPCRQVSNVGQRIIGMC